MKITRDRDDRLDSVMSVSSYIGKMSGDCPIISINPITKAKNMVKSSHNPQKLPKSLKYIYK